MQRQRVLSLPPIRDTCMSAMCPISCKTTNKNSPKVSLSIYESIPHIETKSIDTMGVTSKELLYNEDFVD